MIEPGVQSQMPQSPEDQRVLRERAEALRDSGQTDSQAGLTSFVKFRLGGSERYGIPYHVIDEVFVAGEITPVPGNPSMILGLVNRRGDLLTVLDLKGFLRVADDGGATEPAIIVVSATGLTVGIAADQIDGEDHFDPSNLAAPVPSDGSANLTHALGIHAGTVTILDIEKLLRNVITNLEGRQTSPRAEQHQYGDRP